MKINLLVIKTSRLHELAAFYSLLGLKFDYHKHEKGSFHYSTKLEGTVFEIYPLPKNSIEADNTTRLGFEVKNIENLIFNLRLNKAKILSESMEDEFGTIAIIEDLDGRKIELVEIRHL